MFPSFQEIVENFKRLFPGVYDRMINMSNPINKKYNVAITKQVKQKHKTIFILSPVDFQFL
jgi:structural maintenance of chromosome 1